MRRVAARLILSLMLGWLLSPAVMGMDYEILAVFPHDPGAYTQGLVFERGYLYESTGRRGHSSLRKVDLGTGEVLQRYDLQTSYFAEGITILDGRIFQLTWRSHRGFVYDLDDLRPLGGFSYSTEGWGLTHDGERLIMSDGSANLYFLDPDTFETLATLPVKNGLQPVDKLNELEYIEGLIYANIYQSPRIAVINPVSGELVDSLDLTQLVEAELSLTPSAGVLNGIAYDIEEKKMFVTGKNWRRLYAIRPIHLED